jgi:hypothetical protein
MELLRNRFPLLGHNSDAWKKFYSAKSKDSQQNLKHDLKEYFPSGKIQLSLDSEERVLEVLCVEASSGGVRMQINGNATSRPVHFGGWRKTIQLPTAETGFLLCGVDTENIYPLMTENLCSESDYRQNQTTKMYLSKKMYRCACYEACVVTDQLVFPNEKLEYLYEKLIRELNLSVSRDKILNAVLLRCYETYQADNGYANRLAVLVLAAFSRRRCCFSDDEHQMFMEGMLRAYRTCRRLLMNDLMAVEFFRVWFSRR